jgi:MFS family permease
MFVILPVFAIYAEHLPGGDNLTLVGIAIGAYGLTQAILQIPFGWWSDRYGRKPVIYAGLSVFAAGSLVAALAPTIYVVIAGRVLQGAGAISAAVMAMAADLTREEHRTKTMAMIGSTIGLAFALSLVASPWLNRHIGVPGIFAMTAALALLAMFVVWRIVPDVLEQHTAPARSALRQFGAVLVDPQLGRLNYGIFVLHAVLLSLFIGIPFALRDAGLPVGEHWKVYLPVMLGSFVLMLPAVMRHGRDRLRIYFVGSIALLTLAHLLLPWLHGSVVAIAVFLLLFFTPFNVLEALLPTLTTKLAPPGNKGTAIGVYSSVQFFGTFVGAAFGGYVYSRAGLPGVIALDAVLLSVWVIVALGMRMPSVFGVRTYTLPPLNSARGEALAQSLRLLPGVRDVRLIVEERLAYLTVDSAEFDEHNVLQAITAKAS